MTQTSAPSAAAVLDYAAPRAQDPILRRLRAAIVVLICVLLGMLAGWLFDARMYRAVGYLVIDPSDLSLDTNQVQAHQAAAAAGVAGPGNVQVVISQLPSSMSLTAAEITANLKVRTVLQSRLVEVSYQHDNPRVAAAVVNVAMGRYAAPGVNVAAIATPPAQPQHHRLYLLSGAAIGLLLGIAIIALRWK